MDVYGELSRDKWEAICRKCAKCCYEKVDLGGGVIRYTDEPCEHLDTETKLCKVYDRRHEVEPDCISLTEHLVRFLHWMPVECAYVEYVRHKDTIAQVHEADKKQRRNRKAKRRR
ncbi:MAG: hypothetical protein HY912_22995 [Desulfomonile tiedjei]|uniref:YcgN family cysteine cluster protein n=1 Tax=Desulfomonile tiedjei TaxID=2358 RepID=A0A9D6Z6B8_9BACT|nr:hypothetical protein [Desulfomonile tiedjei]